jgi:hypothetical protein
LFKNQNGVCVYCRIFLALDKAQEEHARREKTGYATTFCLLITSLFDISYLFFKFKIFLIYLFQKKSTNLFIANKNPLEKKLSSHLPFFY